jgi:maleate cis-trans isomerase
MPDTLVSDSSTDRARLATPKARIGLMIPSSNRLAEPQIQHYAPIGLGVHVTRMQVTGKHERPLEDMLEEIERGASALADAKVDLVVFNCTGTSMRDGPEGDARIIDLIEKSTGIEAFSTGTVIIEALQALGLKRLALFSPYRQSVNDHEVDYLGKLGITVVSDLALNLPGSDDFIKVMPERWVEIVTENARDDVDGYFLSCTNTTQIEAIEPLEQRLGKPVVNSNQAVLWACLKRLKSKLGPLGKDSCPGRLFEKI